MPCEQTPPVVLATDLDGTLIPLANCDQNRRDLQALRAELAAQKMTLVYVTGRHFASVQAIAAELDLPLPQWIICDVGTSLFALQEQGRWELLDAYAQHLQDIVGDISVDHLREILSPIEGLRLQEPVKQGRFKLSYYADAAALDALVETIETQLQATAAPYSLIASVDPFNQDGLIDLLPRGVSKAYALEFWSQLQGLDQQAILFAGDSGNDLAALTAGYRSILVSNAAPSLVQQVRELHDQRRWINRLFVATESATSGVLEGLRHYLAGSGTC